MRLIVVAAIAATAAVAAVQQLPALPAGELLAALALAGALLAGVGVWQRGFARQFATALAAAAMAFAWAAWRADLRLAETLPESVAGSDIAVTGIVAEMPQRFARGERFAFDVERASPLAGSGSGPLPPLPSRVMLSWYAAEGAAEVVPTVRPGERWQLAVRLKPPLGNANPHAFDYEAWLLERNIRATGYVRAMPQARRLDRFVADPGYAIEFFREEIRDHFLAALPDKPYAGILIALAVGDQRAINGEFWQVFSRTGTTHLMSISGLHVTMVASLFGIAAGVLWRRSPRLMARVPAQRVAVVAGWAAAMAYALLSGFSVPAQRTVWMLSAVALAALSGRRVAISTTLSAALLLVLAIDPWAVLAPGFWLSFGAVALLFYVACGRIEATGWKAAIRRWTVAQWAVAVGTLPVLLLFFQQFSLVSPLANALAIPAISLLVTPLALLAVILPFPPLLDLAHWLLALVMRVLEYLGELPVYQQPAPPLWAVVVALAGCVWLMLPRGVPARWVGALLFVPALSFVPPRPAVGEAQVIVLDVGQGLAVVVTTATKTLLYDTGPLYSAESDAGQRIVLPYLRAIGVDRLDALIVTHSDSDHSGGAAAVLAALPVERVLSSLPELPGEACRKGLHWQWDGVDFALLYPLAAAPEKATKANHRSCVLRVAAGGRSMLLTADIEAVDERALLADTDPAAPLRADVMLAPHHGSRTSSSPAFIAAVAPQDVVFTVGYRNRFGHPHPEIVRRYDGVRRWRSDRDGALTIRLGADYGVSAWRAERVRYWHHPRG